LVGEYISLSEAPEPDEKLSEEVRNGVFDLNKAILAKMSLLAK
jgi:hypothetical protein